MVSRLQAAHVGRVATYRRWDLSRQPSFVSIWAASGYGCVARAATAGDKTKRLQQLCCFSTPNCGTKAKAASRQAAVLQLSSGFASLQLKVGGKH